MMHDDPHVKRNPRAILWTHSPFDHNTLLLIGLGVLYPVLRLRDLNLYHWNGNCSGASACARTDMVLNTCGGVGVD